MKLQTSFQFCIKELRSNILLFALSAFLMISIFTTGLLLASADECIMKSFYNYTLTMSEDVKGLHITFVVPYEMRSIIEDQPFDNFYFDGDVDDGSNYVFNGVSLEDYSVTVIDYKSDLCQEINERQFKEGIALSEDNFADNSIWVSKELSEVLNCNVGDVISRKVLSGITFDYIITGVYSIDDSSVNDMFISSDRFFHDLNDAGYTREAHFTAILLHPENYNRIKTILRGRNISAWSEFDEEFKMLALIDILLKTLFVVIMFSAMFVVFNIGRIILSSRLAFIMRLRLLGARTENIANIYVLILENILVLSFIISYLICTCFSFYVKRIVAEVIPEIDYIFVDVRNYALVGFLICSFILGIVMIRFKHKADCDNIGLVLLEG